MVELWQINSMNHMITVSLLAYLLIFLLLEFKFLHPLFELLFVKICLSLVLASSICTAESLVALFLGVFPLDTDIKRTILIIIFILLNLNKFILINIYGWMKVVGCGWVGRRLPLSIMGVWYL